MGIKKTFRTSEMLKSLIKKLSGEGPMIGL